MKDGISNVGNLQGVQVLCQGYWGWDDRLVALICGGTADDGDIVSARPKDLLRSGDWREGMPQVVGAVAGVAKDPDWPDTRRRLVVVADGKIWVWRSR